MFDLGTSFVASVARDPGAVAIVDAGLRLTYAQWFTRISSVVAAFDDLGLRPGDHIVTVLQNRWEAATIHWACQLAGLVITPINWRAKSDELDFCIENSQATALVYESVSAGAVAGATFARNLRRIVVGDAVEAERRSPPSPRRTSRRRRSCGAKPVRPLRAHPWRHAALSHHGRALPDLDVTDRRHVCVSSPLRSRPGTRHHCGRKNHKSLSGSNALPRSGPSFGLRKDQYIQHTEARLCRRADDRRSAAEAEFGVQAGSVRQSLRKLGNLHLHGQSKRGREARFSRQSRDQPVRQGRQACRTVGIGPCVD